MLWNPFEDIKPRVDRDAKEREAEEARKRKEEEVKRARKASAVKNFKLMSFGGCVGRVGWRGGGGRMRMAWRTRGGA